MTDEREPVRDTYDAVIDVATNPDWGGYAFGLVKLTYKITENGWELTDPDPLFHDMRDEDVEPRVKGGTDFWPVKSSTDFVVEGSAHSPSEKPTERMQVRVSVGSVKKTIEVFGRRLVRWTDRGNVQFTKPEPFEEVEVSRKNAYGGTDFRVVDPAMEEISPAAEAARLQTNHPGLYPRNPFGKGYLVEPGPVEEFELPHLEDPGDLLTPDRLITGTPEKWHEQPLPWTLDWVHPKTFPRYVFFLGRPEAWYPAPQDEQLAEVRRGYLPANFKDELDERSEQRGPDPRFRQGASHGLVLHDVPERVPVRIEGMHPEKSTVKFRLPPSPSLEMQVEDKRQAVNPRLHSVVVRPAEEQFYVLYAGVMSLDRALIPGIHKHIPMALYVNGDRPVAYDAPVPLREQLAAAMEQER
ncbi:DUF2169 domain-containing protein [Salinibacter ruber]|uniref:DUF2169 domain-containing protein n=1 Tax=Salinibacter ruber TaxID=146919 RepID=UPI000E6CE9A8|nr:DUF2169 domain-containing protein [Salinibacter ruber]